MAPTVRLVGDLLVLTFRYDPALNTALREAAGVRWDAGRKAFTLPVERLRQAGAAERLGRFVVESGFEADDAVRTLLGLAAPTGAAGSGLPVQAGAGVGPRVSSGAPVVLAAGPAIPGSAASGPMVTAPAAGGGAPEACGDSAGCRQACRSRGCGARAGAVAG